MLRSIITSASLLLFTSHLFASANSSSGNNGDDSHQNTDSDNPQPVAASEGSAVTRREPKPLTPMGAAGLIVMIGIMGFFTVWVLNDDTQQA